MSRKKRIEFFNWYNLNKDIVFDLKHELFTYCKSDVDILKKGCLTQRKILINESKIDCNDVGIDPFCVSYTLLSFCHALYRRKHMSPESIAIIPENGYDFREKTSFKCQLWLKYVSKKSNILITHARNNREKKYDEYIVDGYCEENNTIFEFHGCFFHGCLKCYTPETFNKMLQKL